MAGNGSTPQDRRDAAVKVGDNVYTTYLISPWTKRLLPFLSERVTPNAVTLVSIVLALAAAGLFATGDLAAIVAGAIVYQLSFAADCVDGQLARYDGAGSRFGALLDWQFDRVKETAVIVGMAAGAGGPPGAWVSGAAVLAVLAARSAITVTYTMADADDGDKMPSQSDSFTRLARSAVLLPYGDRHLVLGLLAVFLGLGEALLVLVIWNSIAAIAQLGGRLARGRHSSWGESQSDVIGNGVIATTLRPMVPFRVHVLIAAGIASIPAWVPQHGPRRAAQLLILLGLLLAARTVPSWLTPLMTLTFEISAIAFLGRASVDDALVIGAMVAMTLQRHFVNSDALTGGSGRGWMWDPLGWELRSTGWILGALAAPVFAVATLVYSSTVALVRLVADLRERRRLDLAATG